MHSASHYQDLLDKERASIAGLCAAWQLVLKETSCIPDDVCGTIQIAIGQAQLLLKKKFEQFQGLITLSQDKVSERKVTVDDLQGFWEMMYIQIEDIYKKFDEIEKLKKNNWEPLPTTEKIQRQPLGNLNKAASGDYKPVFKKDFSAEAKERLAKAKAIARKKMEEQSRQ